MVRKNVLIIFILLVFGCQTSDDDTQLDSISEIPAVNSEDNLNEESSTTMKSFDREQMLTFIVNHIIIPSFNNLETNLGELKTSFDLFNESVTEDNLTDLRNKWLDAYNAWQSVEIFNIVKQWKITICSNQIFTLSIPLGLI